MTNADFIKEQFTRLSDREIAEIVYQYYGIKTSGIECPKILKAARAKMMVQLLLFGHGKDGICQMETGRIKEGQQKCLYKSG